MAPSQAAPARSSRRAFLSWLAAGTAGVGGAALLGSACAPAQGGKQSSLRIGYLPITDATPLLVAHARGHYREQGLDPAPPTLFRSWAQIAEAFQARQVDVVHLLMPMTVWLRFGQRFPATVVAWGHVDGSALTVVNGVQRLEDLAGTTVAVPFWYSIHNVVLQLLFRQAGLTPILKGEPSPEQRTVKLVVMGPPDMPPALEQGTIRGYIVADPFNAAAELAGIGKVLRFTGDVWQNHACCVVVMREDETRKRPEWAQAVVNAVARAQLFSREQRQETARLLSRDGQGYLPQPLPVIERALAHYDHAEYVPSGAIRHPAWGSSRIDFQPFPFPSYTAELVRRLKETAVEGQVDFLKTLAPEQAHRELVNEQFAREAIDAVGGPTRFAQPGDLRRQEQIDA